MKNPDRGVYYPLPQLSLQTPRRIAGNEALTAGARALRASFIPMSIVGTLIYFVPRLLAIACGHLAQVGPITPLSPLKVTNHFGAGVVTLVTAALNSIGLALLAQLFLCRNEPLPRRAQGFMRRIPSIFVLTFVVALAALLLLIPSSAGLLILLLTAAAPFIGLPLLAILFVPPLTLVCRLSLVLYVCVGEKVGPRQAIKRSFALTKGRFWSIACLLFIYLLAGVAFIIAKNAIAPDPKSPLWDSYAATPTSLTSLTLSLVQALLLSGLLLPLLWSGLGAIYEDARAEEAANLTMAHDQPSVQ